MYSEAEFRSRLNTAIGRRHQANHPFIDKFARGEVKPEAVAGTITEIWYWISKLIPEALFSIAANGPQEVVEMEMENYGEELDPTNPHPALIQRFAKACGVSAEQLAAGRGLPTTEAWLRWSLNTCRTEHWIAAVAAVLIVVARLSRPPVRVTRRLLCASGRLNGGDVNWLVPMYRPKMRCLLLN